MPLPSYMERRRATIAAFPTICQLIQYRKGDTYMGFGTIQHTALTTDQAIRYFGDRIQVDHYRGDVTMATLCRMLFGPRLKNGEKITVRVLNFLCDDTNESLKEAVREFASAPDGTLYVCCLTCLQEKKGVWKTDMADMLTSIGLHPMKDIMLQLDTQKKNTLFYTNTRPDAKTPRSPFDNTKSFVIVENMGVQIYTCVCTLLKRLLGKWFAEQPMTEAEIEGCQKALQEGSPDKFLAAAAAYADSLDLRGVFIRESLKDFETRFVKERVTALEKEAQQCDRQMDDYETAIGMCLQKKDDILAQLFGYRMMEKQDEPVTMNYFLANKNLILVGTSAKHIEFYDYGWLDQFDPEKAKATFGCDRMSAWLESNRSFGVSDEDAKLLYKAIFLEDKVKIRLWSHFKLCFRDDSPLSTYDNGPSHGEITHALPNPHHQYHRCPGNNRRLIEEAVRRRDVVGAVTQCLSATKGVNLIEQASYKYLARDLFDPQYGEVIYVNALDKFLTTKDAIAWLKENV